MRELPIGEFCLTGSGGTPSREKAGRYYEGGSIPWVKSGELKEKVITETEEYVTEDALTETSIKLVPAGALLLAMYGATVGRIGLLGVPATTNQAVCHIIPDPMVADIKYLFHALASRVEVLISRTVGGAQPNINQGIVRELKIPLPPLAEQRRIAAILDHAEALRAKRREAIGKLYLITDAIFFDKFGDPISNPKNWPTGTLGDVASFVGGGTPSRAQPEFFNGSVCWATSKDMKSEFLDDTEEHITPEAIEQSATKLVQPGTILVVVKSKILARRLPVAIARVPTCFGQDLKGIQVTTGSEVMYVVAALRVGSAWLLERARGVNTEGLTLDHLRAFPLPLAPLPLQQEFARQVEAINRLKASHQASLAKLDELFASLQHRAFRGELTGAGVEQAEAELAGV